MPTERGKGLESLLGFDVPFSADALRSRLALQVADGIDQAGDSYRFNEPYSDGHTYGTDRWRFVLKAVGGGYDDIEGVGVFAARTVRLPILPTATGGSVLLYPICFADDAYTSADGAQVRPSPLRRLLLGVDGTRSRHLQPMLPFDNAALEGEGTARPTELSSVDDAESVGIAEAEAEFAGQEGALRTLVVGYASNARAGLLQLVIGEATMSSDGTLSFDWFEELPMHPGRTALDLVGSSEAGFDQGPEPGYGVPLRPEDDADDNSDG